MKVCLLTPRYPFPENGGDVLRINGIARYLKSRGHELILVSFINKNQSISKIDYNIYDKIITVRYNKVISYFYSILFFILQKPIQCGYYYSPVFERILESVLRKDSPDLFISHLCRMETYLSKNKLQNKSIIEMTDALSKTYSLSSKQNGISLKKTIYKIEKRRIASLEKKIIKEFSKVVLVSQDDINYLGRVKSLAFHTNGIKLYDNRSSYESSKICFVGNMRTLQNQDAVITFVKRILPIIKHKICDIQFHIVGAQPNKTIKELHDGKNIFVTGFVDSVEDYIKDSCILVAPVNIAAGIQNKVLIGMACKIPVIMTSLISKAIPEAISETNCIIEDDYECFAQKCIQLMQNSDYRNRIAENGYAMVANNYSWEKKLEGYEVL